MTPGRWPARDGGHTWSNRNPLAATGLYPDRHLTTSSRPGPASAVSGIRAPAALLGVPPAEALQLSDHYGVTADLRY